MREMIGDIRKRYAKFHQSLEIEAKGVKVEMAADFGMLHQEFESWLVKEAVAVLIQK